MACACSPSDETVEGSADAAPAGADSTLVAGAKVPASGPTLTPEQLLGDTLAPHLVALSVPRRAGRPQIVPRDRIASVAAAAAPGPLMAHLRVDSCAHVTRLAAPRAWRDGDLLLGAAAFPRDLAEAGVAERKHVFLAAVLPAVRYHNRIIAQQRQWLLGRDPEAGISQGERHLIERLADYYGLEDVPGLTGLADTLSVLRLRVDIVPAAIAVAQAAIESGWGTSRFSRQGNNLYGQRVWTDSIPGLAAAGAPQARFRVATFPVLGASVGSYMRNLNSHPAYAGFRTLRQQLRAEGRALDPRVLVPTLTSYSTRGEEYVADLASIMDYNELDRLDSERRPDPSD